MSDLLPFIIIGLTSGAVYGLAGVGLVLTYKTSGVFNFGHGALAAVSAYVFYTFYVSLGWAWPIAAFVAVLIAGPIMGLFLELLARRLAGASLAVSVAATVGLVLLIDSAINLIYGTTQFRQVPPYLPQNGPVIAGVTVQWSQIITFAFAVLVTVALSVFFRRSRAGMAMRAVVDNPELLDMAGTSVLRTRRLAWIIGATLAGASGVLFAPLLPTLDPLQLTLLVVAAFGAAAIGGFSRLPLTLIGGLAIGVLASLSETWFATNSALSALPVTLPFWVLFAALMFFPKKYLGGKQYTVPRGRPTWAAPGRLQIGASIVLLAALATVPAFAGIHLVDWIVAVAFVTVFLSLGLLVRVAGQVSLAHVAFMAIGATAFAHLTGDARLPWMVALFVAGLIAVPIGIALAIPAIRLSGLYLALATFGFGIVLQYMFYPQDYMFGTSGLGLVVPRPGTSWMSSDSGFYYVVLALGAFTAAVVLVLNRTRLGRLLRGLADSPTALETSGLSVNVTRLIAFGLSAFLAASGGALVAAAQGTASSISFSFILSLNYLVLVMIVVGGAPWYAILAAFSLVLIPSYTPAGDTVALAMQALFGISAIALAMAPAGSGDVTRMQRAIDRWFRRPQTSRPAQGASAAPRPIVDR